MATKRKPDRSQVHEFCQAQLQSCKLLVEKHPQDDLPRKALSAVQSSLDKLNKVTTETAAIPVPSYDSLVREAILDYAQSCLDSTYHEECQLIDDEFPEDVSDGTIRRIITTLSRPFQLCQLVGSDSTLLGTEVIECLHWRVGALLYMYCHMTITVEERKKRLNIDHFKECCCAGVGHLKLMLSTRTPLGKDEDYTAHDTSVPSLLEKGIFSDIHMLSLMYAGELCYWYWELFTTQTSPELNHTKSELEPSTESYVKTETGQKCNKVDTVLGDESQQDTQVESSHYVCSESQIPVSKEVLQSESKETPKSLPSGDSTDTMSGSSREEFDCHSRNHSIIGLSSLFCVMEHSQGAEFVKQWVSDFDPQKNGRELLSKYIDVARGPLKAQGWNYDRAVQLLVQLRIAERAS